MRAWQSIINAVTVAMALNVASVAQGFHHDNQLPLALSPTPPSSAQDSSSSDHVDSDAALLPAAPSAAQQEVQQQRFRSQLDTPPDRPQRLSAEDKFNIFVENTSSPFTFAAAGVSAGLSQATDSAPGFGQGWRGFGKRYGAALADSESSAFFTKFLIPVLAHQDPRYKRNGREAFLPRLFGAVSQVVDTVDDDGDPQFNYSQVLGTAISASIANAYYPVESRGFHRTANRAVNGLGGAAASNIFREFWPDIKRKLTGRRKVDDREVEALRWQTGAQPSITPAPQ